MTLEIKFYKAEDVYASGIGVRCGETWRYYLPFKRVGLLTTQDHDDGTHPGSTVAYAMKVSESRILAASQSGELALIDFLEDRIVARSKVPCRNPMIQRSADGRYIYVQDEYKVYVLNAETLEVVQNWHWLEHTDTGWVRYTTASAEAPGMWRQKVDRGTIERLDLVEPVLDVGGGKLSGRFLRAAPGSFGPREYAGSYLFDIATGAVERQSADPPVAAGNNAPARRRGLGLAYAKPRKPREELRPHPRLASQLSCLDTPPTGPAEFQDLVAREAMVTLSVADTSRGAAIAVLDDLAARMERDLESMIMCDSFYLRLMLNGKKLDTGAFFDRFVQEGWREAVPLLRRILLAYLNHIPGGEGSMPWSYKGWAVGETDQPIRVLRALVLLDADQQDVYRLYIDKGDLEHDTHPYALYAEYVGRHGVRNESDIIFGIYLIVKGCNGAAIDTTGLMAGAERHVTPERFADFVMEALLRRYMIEGGGGDSAAAAAIMPDAGGLEAASERVTDALRRARAEWDYGFDTACLACLGRVARTEFSRRVHAVLAARLS